MQFRPGIAAIGEDMPQRRVSLADGFGHAGGAIAVLNIGGMDNKIDQVPERIGDDVPLAALDLLPRIEPARPAHLGCFHRLGVDHARGGRCRASSQFPRLRDQGTAAPAAQALA